MQSKLDQQGAESVAVQALGYLAQDPERLTRFLGETGIDPGEIRAAAAQDGFLLGVLEHVCADESFLLAFAANAGLAPQSIAAARRKLAVAGKGGQESSADESFADESWNGESWP